MQLSLLALPVIPELRISDLGLGRCHPLRIHPCHRNHGVIEWNISLPASHPKSHYSVSQRLHDQLGQIIAATKPGERLPSEPALAEKLGVSRATLREAMRTFETQGMIRRRQGSGTYVNQPPQVLETGLEVLESIESIAERSGLSVEMGELNVQYRKAKLDECESLDLDPCKDVVQVSRVIYAEHRAVAYLIDILPGDILDPEELKNGFNGSILDLLLQRGQPDLYHLADRNQRCTRHLSGCTCIGYPARRCLTVFHCQSLSRLQVRSLTIPTATSFPAIFAFMWSAE